MESIYPVSIYQSFFLVPLQLFRCQFNLKIQWQEKQKTADEWQALHFSLTGFRLGLVK